MKQFDIRYFRVIFKKRLARIVNKKKNSGSYVKKSRSWLKNIFVYSRLIKIVNYFIATMSTMPPVSTSPVLGEIVYVSLFAALDLGGGGRQNRLRSFSRGMEEMITSPGPLRAVLNTLCKVAEGRSSRVNGSVGRCVVVLFEENTVKLPEQEDTKWHFKSKRVWSKSKGEKNKIDVGGRWRRTLHHCSTSWHTLRYA